MTRPIKDMFLDIVEEWDTFWRDTIEFVDFINKYVEINDDKHSYVIKEKRPRIEVES